MTTAAKLFVTDDTVTSFQRDGVVPLRGVFAPWVEGVREAIEQRDYDEVEPQIEIAAGVLSAMAERIEQVTRAIE